MLRRAIWCGVLLMASLQSLCADELPHSRYHLTARPFERLPIERADYLAVVEGLCRYLAQWQDASGAVIDPHINREHQYATPYFAYSVGVLLAEGRAPELRAAGIKAMDHATACLANGYRGIPDRHGEFFLSPLADALELYQGRVDETIWQTWFDRLETPLTQVMENQQGRTNNWRTYAMKGEWLRCRTGLVEREDAIRFVEDSWVKRSQRERIVADALNFYQDWSSDPQSHAVEAVGRGNLLGLVAAGYDGPARNEIQRAVRRGTTLSMLWQDPSGQCPPNGRTDNHVFNDVLYQLTYEIMAEDARAQGETALAGQYRRAAMLSFRSIDRWRRRERPFEGSYYVTKNHFPPTDRVGYQPASQDTNYNGAIAYHLAEAVRSWRAPIEQRAAPTEIGGYVVAADPRFGSLVANAGGMQVMINLRGDSVPKYGQYWTPLGVVRFARVDWDSRLGPADGAHDAGSGRAVTFAPTWREGTRWIRLAERAKDYRGTLHCEFVHPSLVRFHILYHTVTGSGGPSFRHDFLITPDGVLTTLHCSDDVHFGLTLPVVVDDGRSLDVNRTPPCITVAYPRQIEPSGDAQNFILLDAEVEVNQEEPIRSAVGWLQPLRVTSRANTISVFVYPSSKGDPSASDVRDSFQMRDDGFVCSLGRVRQNLYEGRTSTGGWTGGGGVKLGSIELAFGSPCGFLLERDARGVVALETDRRVEVRLHGRTWMLDEFAPLKLREVEKVK